MPEGFDPDSAPSRHRFDTDEEHLASLGYRQELHRSWSGFANFAISFSIISILAGCFTTFSSGWNGGGPAAIAWGWPILSVLILCIGLCLAELVSAFPTAGGIYWWSSQLGGPRAGYYTGWLNLIGLLAIVASVAYGCATFFDLVLGFFSTDYRSGDLHRIFLYFVVVLAIAAVLNIFSSHLLASFNRISVWWHLIGAALVVAILVFIPDRHADASMVFTSTVNNTGFFGGRTGGLGFFLVILPIGGLLTQYTITGFDASAHLSEETKQASASAARGIWRSIVVSAIGGWILLLAILFAVQNEAAVTSGGGGVAVILSQALSSRWGAAILLISAGGQFFCTMAAMTSCSRMLFAFSRDGAVPGHSYWSKLSTRKVPVHSVLLTMVVGIALTAPALIKVDIAGVAVPVAFYAVVSIGVIGLYWCFAIAIWHRLRLGTRFQPGPWNLGNRYRVLCGVALLDTVLITVMAFMPTSNLGVPWTTGFAWKYVNYTVLVVPVAMTALWAYWHLSVKRWFTGPKRNLELPGEAVPDPA